MIAKVDLILELELNLHVDHFSFSSLSVSPRKHTGCASEFCLNQGIPFLREGAGGDDSIKMLLVTKFSLLQHFCGLCVKIAIVEYTSKFLICLYFCV